MKKLKQVLLLTLVVIIILSLTIIKGANTELRTIKSERELYNFYDNSYDDSPSLIKKILLLPFGIRKPGILPQKPHLGEPHPRVGVLVINR